MDLSIKKTQLKRFPVTQANNGNDFVHISD